MIVNRSMFPLQTGFGVISKMQDKFANLQMQLGTGMKSSTLAGMGRDLPMSLSVRSRLGGIEAYSANIDTVNLRLSFFDKTMSRFDKIEGEARNSAMQGQYGTNNINMATLPDLSKARLDEMVTMLNSDIAGRYLFGGSNTDNAPLPTTNVLLDGQGLQAGFRTVLTERQAADAGDGKGRLTIGHTAPSPTVSLTEDGVHPFGFKISGIVPTPATASITGGTVGPSAAVPLPGIQTGNTTSITFASQPVVGQQLTVGLTLPDGTQTQVVMTAVAAGTSPLSPGQFALGADEAATAANFSAAFDTRLREAAGTQLSAASAFEAAENFFNASGEPVLRVSGNPATAQSLRIANDTDTVMWYRGQSAAISAQGLGRMSIQTGTNSVSLTERQPVSTNHGFQITGVSTTTGDPLVPSTITATHTAADPSSANVQFGGLPVLGETVSVTLQQPDGTTRAVNLVAVDGKAGPGQFTRSADPATNAANFSKALNTAITEVAIAAEGNPRQTVTAQVDDSTRVSYGMQANESGFLNLMRTMAAMSVTTYPDADTTSKGRFDGMAQRQQAALSEARNSERGSIEILTMELGVARSTLDNATKRHTDYKAQLENLLSDVETVSKEDVAMEILALQTRLTASYQATSMVSKLSLVNFL